MDELRTLSCSNNNIHGSIVALVQHIDDVYSSKGTIPDSIVDMEKLNQLHLFYNDLSGAALRIGVTLLTQ
jgi:hypothetical protein